MVDQSKETSQISWGSPNYGSTERLEYEKLSLFTKIRYLVLAIGPLLAFVYSLACDVGAVYSYGTQLDYGFLVISVISVLTPILMYNFYRWGIFLSQRKLVGDGAEDPDRQIGDGSEGGLEGGLSSCSFIFLQEKFSKHFNIIKIVFSLLSSSEKEAEFAQLKTEQDVMEYFYNVYSGFIDITSQTYVILSYLNITSFVDSDRKPFYGVLLSSILSLYSLFTAAIKREDDIAKYYIFALSGWTFFMASRVLALALITRILHYWVIILCLIHVFGFSIWIFKLAVKSFLESRDEIELTTRRKIGILILIIFLFGFPSLFIWPMMFKLKVKPPGVEYYCRLFYKGKGGPYDPFKAFESGVYYTFCEQIFKIETSQVLSDAAELDQFLREIEIAIF